MLQTLSQVKVRDVPVWAKSNLTTKNVSHATSSWIQNYGHKYVRTGSGKPIVHVMLALGLLGYIIEYPHLAGMASLAFVDSSLLTLCPIASSRTLKEASLSLFRRVVLQCTAGTIIQPYYHPPRSYAVMPERTPSDTHLPLGPAASALCAFEACCLVTAVARPQGRPKPCVKYALSYPLCPRPHLEYSVGCLRTCIQAKLGGNHGGELSYAGAAGHRERLEDGLGNKEVRPSQARRGQPSCLDVRCSKVDAQKPLRNRHS